MSTSLLRESMLRNRLIEIGINIEPQKDAFLGDMASMVIKGMISCTLEHEYILGVWKQDRGAFMNMFNSHTGTKGMGVFVGYLKPAP